MLNNKARLISLLTIISERIFIKQHALLEKQIAQITLMIITPYDTHTQNRESSL